ncbi:MAG: hypothetical protein R3C19_02940 [Planctomycetaceae bacterium]
MFSFFRRRSFLLLACVAVITATLSGTAGQVRAQSDDENNPLGIRSVKTGTKPLVVASLASLNRAKEKLAYVFDAAGAPDTLDAILSRIEDNAGGLEGIDWDRPIGIMAYLGSVFPPAFEFVVFMPVDDIASFQRTLELGTVVMVNVPNQDGRYELIGPQQTSQMRIEQGYAFIQLPFFEPDPAFDRDLPAPETLAAALATQFDVAITLDVEAVPKATRDLILNLLTATMSTQMQQRDDEPESLYEIRRSWMQGDIDGLKLLMDELNRLTIGVRVSAEERSLNLDMVFEAPEGTKLLQEIFESTAKPSYFTPLLSDESPVSLSMSSILSKRDRERYSGVFEGLKHELARQIDINGLGDAPEENGPLNSGLSALQKTFMEGHLDLFGQCYADSSDKLAIVGAWRVEDGDAIAAGLFDLLQRVKDQKDIGDIQTGYNEHAGITFHRIVFKGTDPARDELFGRNSAFIFGVGTRSAWGCVGGDDAFRTLTGVMDQLAAAYESPQERQAPPSFRLVVNVNQLLELQQGVRTAVETTAADEAAETGAEGQASDTAGQDQGRPNRLNNPRERFRQRREQAGKRFRETMAEGGDRIEVDFRLIENGGRTRIKLGEAFVRFIGRQVASRFGGESD